MPAVLPEKKTDFTARLKHFKLWSDFTSRRDELRRDGMTAKDYWPKLMREFSPGKCREMVANRFSPAAQAFGIVRAEDKPDVDAPIKPKPKGNKVGVHILPNGMPLVDEDTWEGRPSITFEEAVTWADSMRAIRGVEPEDCPSSVAYEKLWSAQNSPEGSKHLDALMMKIVGKRKRTDNDGVDIDAYTERLVKMIDESKAEASGGE